MDEPCSALDPIATAQIEELIDELRENYTIVIVTHTMQQAARVSQKTAFFHLGKLVESGETEQIFTNAARRADPGLHHRPVRLRSGPGACSDKQTEHIVKSLRRGAAAASPSMIARMGGLAERQLDRAVEALVRRDTELAAQVVQPTTSDRRAGARGRRRWRSACSRCASRWRTTCARWWRRSRSPPTSSASATTPRTSPSARSCSRRVAPLKPARRDPAHGPAGAGRCSRTCSTPTSSATRQGARRSGGATRRSTSSTTALFRELLTYMMEDPRNIRPCTHLLFIAKNLERIGDHATNIAENIYYLVHGRSLDDERPKGDDDQCSNRRLIAPSPARCPCAKHRPAADPGRRGRSGAGHAAALQLEARLPRDRRPPTARRRC